MSALIHDPNQVTIDNALAVFKNAHVEFLKLDYRKLFIAKEVGEALLPLLKIPDLGSNRAITRLLNRAGYNVSPRTVDDYIFVATYWTDIVKAVGDKLKQIGYKKAIQMVREQAKLLTYAQSNDGWKEEHGGFNREFPSGRFYAIHPKTIDQKPCWMLCGEGIPEQEMDAGRGPFLFFQTLAEAKAKADEFERQHPQPATASQDTEDEADLLTEGPAKVLHNSAPLPALAPDHNEEDDGTWLTWKSQHCRPETYTASDSNSDRILYRIIKRRGEHNPWNLTLEDGDVLLGEYAYLHEAKAEAFRHSWKMPGWNVYWLDKQDYDNLEVGFEVNWFPTLDEAKAFAERQHGGKIGWVWDEIEDRIEPENDLPGNFTIYAENPPESDDQAEVDEATESLVDTLTKDNADDILEDRQVAQVVPMEQAASQEPKPIYLFNDWKGERNRNVPPEKDATIEGDNSPPEDEEFKDAQWTEAYEAQQGDKTDPLGNSMFRQDKGEWYPKDNSNGQQYATRLSDGRRVPYDGTTCFLNSCYDFGFTENGTLEFFSDYGGKVVHYLLMGDQHGSVRAALMALIERTDPNLQSLERTAVENAKAKKKGKAHKKPTEVRKGKRS